MMITENRAKVKQYDKNFFTNKTQHNTCTTYHKEVKAVWYFLQVNRDVKHWCGFG